MSANKTLWLATASALVLFAGAPAMAQEQQPNVTVVQPAQPAADAAAGTAEQASQAADAAAEKADDAADQAEAAADNATETDTADAETPVQGQIFTQSPNQYLASTLLDAVVMNPADEEIGDVNDMIVTKEGQVEGVVIGVGGFLGVGEKNVAIELSRLQISQDSDDGDLHFTLDATQDELSNAPEFTTAEDQRSDAEANSAPAAGSTMGGATTAPAAQ
jgi:hypothetical protein